MGWSQREASAFLVAAGSVKEGAWHAHDAILEMLNLHDAGQQKLGTGSSANSTAGAGSCVVIVGVTHLNHLAASCVHVPLVVWTPELLTFFAAGRDLVICHKSCCSARGCNWT